MAYIIRGQYYNNKEQAIKYNEMAVNAKKFIDKDGNFLDNDCSINIPKGDNDMFFAYNFAILGQTIKEKRLQLLGDSTNNTVLEDNLRMLSKEFFPITGYLNRIIDANNDFYKEFNHPVVKENNPWIIDKHRENVMTSEFGSEVGYNSRIELIAKNLLWSNRATKELDIIRRHIVEENAGEKGKCRAYGKNLEYMVDRILVDNGQYDGEGLYTDFLDKYTACLYGEYNKGQLKTEASYRKVKSFKKKDMKDVTMDEIFKYTSVSFIETLLYDMKDKLIELAIKEVGELKKEKKMNGLKISKINDANAKSETYNTVLQIVLPGYSAPFTVHANEKRLTDLATKYKVNYESKDYHSPGMSVCVYKYNNKQMEQLKKIKAARLPNDRVKKCVEYANETCSLCDRYER